MEISCGLSNNNNLFTSSVCVFVGVCACGCSSYEEALPLEVSQALMDVMCEQLQGLLLSVRQQEALETSVVEHTEPHASSTKHRLESKSGNTNTSTNELLEASVLILLE